MNRLISNAVKDIPVASVTISPGNMRRYYDKDSLNTLSSSISRIGQIYPVIVCELPKGKFELVIGTRRLKVAKQRNKTMISAIVCNDLEDQDIVVLSLSENLHRKDLNPFEEAKACLMLCKEYGMTPKQAADRIGVTQSFVTNRLKLLSLPQEVQDMLVNGEIALNHAGTIASLGTPKEQVQYARAVARESLSGEDLVTLVQDELKKKAERPARSAAEPRSVPTTQTVPAPSPRKRGGRLVEFTPVRTALKLKRFREFLMHKVQPKLVSGKGDVREIVTELQNIRGVIGEMLKGVSSNSN